MKGVTICGKRLNEGQVALFERGYVGSPKHNNIDQPRMLKMVDQDIFCHASNVQIEKGCIMESTGCQE